MSFGRTGRILVPSSDMLYERFYFDSTRQRDSVNKFAIARISFACEAATLQKDFDFIVYF